MSNTALVVTSIAAPNPVLRAFADGCKLAGHNFIVVGDAGSPSHFELNGCSFYSLKDQLELGFKFAAACPQQHYARKNIGYLIAQREGANQIIETDDDNLPYPTFWSFPADEQRAATVTAGGWVNVLRYFSEVEIWPRGFPLNRVKEKPPPFESLSEAETDCPIRHGLTDNDPDVDAIYRLTASLPQTFSQDRRVVLLDGSWCPFGSQNTAWSRVAFPLLYLPAHSSFRLTDIWRSFVAQRIAWANKWGILFHEPTVYQERNQHNLMKDFRDELPGYLHNGELCDALKKLQLREGREHIPENLRICYEKLVGMHLLPEQELELLDAWLDDLGKLA